MGTSKKTISYQYDSAGNRSLMIDPNGGRTTYSYDALNRISSLINPQGERTTYAYDAAGRRTVKKLANGTRASFTYDAASRLTTLANLKSDNSVISKFDYQYDKAGNRTAAAENDGSRVTYLYDATYQLTGEHRTGTPPYRNTFTYDSRGNRTLKNESGTRTTYTYDNANQLRYSLDSTGRTTYAFDANGNQERVLTPTGDRTTTTWDYENRTTLVQLPSGIRNTMAYEPDGLRVKLEESAGVKKFIWDNQNYLAETNATHDTQVVYTNEPRRYGNLVSQRRSGATSFYHSEALGSTRQLTNSSETVTDTYLYDAWGNVLTSTGATVNPYQWTGSVGYYFDLDTEDFYIRARTYRPTTARWLSVDLIRRRANAYLSTYISLVADPSGLDPLLEEYFGRPGENCADCHPNPNPLPFDPSVLLENQSGPKCRTITLTAKSFIADVVQSRSLEEVPCNFPPTPRGAMGNWFDQFAISSVYMPFQEDPSTPSSRDRDFRLYTKLVVKMCCCPLSAQIVSTDQHGGIEPMGYQGTINLDMTSVECDSRTKCCTVSWRGYGRPDPRVEPVFQSVAPRRATNIWHQPGVVFCCKDGWPEHTGSAFFRASSFPSHRVWFNDQLIMDRSQGQLADLWKSDFPGHGWEFVGRSGHGRCVP
ncbi:tRNA3(Ser)-specific nuclease WapA precursor [Thalassoglobus neptunius]|uniref:tRNA3(Ser)-specific nuclease WapA n=1 Tax=Thalassoglobus neptunius TaxID=1938619 RepID=A0A5C5VZ89_9PLAN|nr:RHS repeat protein [Thalassoglobus neptunius]TWT43071.1 tRNA3(Ser)-specific nuclease WapA precursor [Thalassoglobus neptunius]